MNNIKITNEDINKIFINKINYKPKKIIPIDIGFSSKLYNIDNKYILKIKITGNEPILKKGYSLQDFFEKKYLVQKQLFLMILKK